MRRFSWRSGRLPIVHYRIRAGVKMRYLLENENLWLALFEQHGDVAPGELGRNFYVYNLRSRVLAHHA